MIAVRLRGSSSNKVSNPLMKDTSSQIQILDLANSDLNKKGRQLPAGQSFFVNFWSPAPHSLEILIETMNQRYHNNYGVHK